ncbi:unnamed protein product [Hyaloperonospora brassicae]|uniref:RxLR effector candidate protein n=1 Tax=Hyaloperonospora brassicae TaxID=162125 RepID=A0AAV0T347_HYABA|nr:unnamed protein product [Hyaloperonospora brassicae]
MRLAYVTVAVLANLLARGDAISPVDDPKAVLGLDIAPVDLVVDGHADGVNTERRWQDVREHNDSNAVQVGNEERFFGIADKVKLLSSKVRQSVIVGKDAGLAVTAASTAKAQTTELAVRLKSTTDMSRIEVARRWNQMRNTPTSQMTKINLTGLLKTVTDALTVATYKSKLSLNAIASKYRAVMDELPDNLAFVWNMLATHPVVADIGAKLQELVADLIMTATIFMIKVQLKKYSSKMEATIIRFFNKFSPQGKQVSIHAEEKTKRTRFAEKVTNAMLHLVVKVIKVVLKKHKVKYESTADYHLGSLVSHRKIKAVGWTSDPTTKLSELAETITNSIMTALMSKYKRLIWNWASSFVVNTLNIFHTSGPNRMKSTIPFVRKIKSTILKLLRKLTGAMTKVAVSIIKGLNELIEGDK